MAKKKKRKKHVAKMGASPIALKKSSGLVSVAAHKRHFPKH